MRCLKASVFEQFSLEFEILIYFFLSLNTEREYQCLGQWQENDVIYIYTKRRDVGTHECFAGSMTRGEIYIKEAGEHCQRDIDPNRYGMQLKQTKYCNSNHRKIDKHPLIGHMSAVTIRPTDAVHLNNSYGPVPAFSPMPPAHKILDLPIDKINDSHASGGVETTTFRLHESSPTTHSEKAIHNDIHQHDYNEQTANDSNETIQFIVNNGSSLAKDDQQYVVSTVTKGPGSGSKEVTKHKTPTESDFNRSQSSFQISLLTFSTALIVNCWALTVVGIFN